MNDVRKDGEDIIEFMNLDLDVYFVQKEKEIEKLREKVDKKINKTQVESHEVKNESNEMKNEPKRYPKRKLTGLLGTKKIGIINERLSIKESHRALKHFFNTHVIKEKNKREFLYIRKAESRFFTSDVSEFPIDNQTLRNMILYLNQQVTFGYYQDLLSRLSESSGGDDNEE
ncbi:hypothetical protein LCGC14_0809840 [marine sediment metagenome]|uniref:Uncharacterized protein n=1 Tax=marine sediment metagenome TaxID=412755 RepID=A0A0F9Q775_9ZZZZ|nr:MAG: hypothetical protein Lokiarch_40130 [Candidatus Lokiarchaeum sp. GC14_75]